MKLVENWREAWKWHSVWIIAALSAAPYVWAELPDDLKASIPSEWLPLIAVLVGVAGIFGRVRDQS